MKFATYLILVLLIAGCAGCRQTKAAAGDAEFPQTERWWR